MFSSFKSVTYIVYVLEKSDKRMYVGVMKKVYTDDSRAISYHMESPEKYRSGKIIFEKELTDPVDAINFQKKLKTLNRRELRKIIQFLSDDNIKPI